jgi:hypothetical protein
MMHRPPHQYEEEEGYRRAGYGRKELQPPLLVDGGRCVELGLISLQLLDTRARGRGRRGGREKNVRRNPSHEGRRKIRDEDERAPSAREAGVWGDMVYGSIVFFFLPAAVSARRLCDPPPSPCIRCNSNNRHWQSPARHRPSRRSIAIRNRHRHFHPLSSSSSSSSMALHRERILRTIPSSRPRRRPRRRRREGIHSSNDAMISSLSYSSTSNHNARRGGGDDVAMRMTIRLSSSP